MITSSFNDMIIEFVKQKKAKNRFNIAAIYTRLRNAGFEDKDILKGLEDYDNVLYAKRQEAFMASQDMEE